MRGSKIERRTIVKGLAAAPLLIAPAARAQSWPDKPVRVLVPFSPGSATDVVARLIGDSLSRGLGQTFVVENRAGAGGTIAATQVAKAPPDGYMLLVHSSGHTVNPALYKDLQYDTVKDLTGVSTLAQQPNILVCATARGWKSAADLVAAAKAAPGKLTYASAGTGSGTHMNAEKFKASAGFDALHVPYKGTPEALNDTMNGRVDFFFAPVVAALGLVREGRITALAAGSAGRSSVLPDVPTTQEAGFAGSAYEFWVGMLAAAATPAAILEKLNGEIRKILAAPETRERLASLGAEAMYSTPADFNARIVREIAENGRIVEAAGIKAQ